MHPNKFMRRGRQEAAPQMSESERNERLIELGITIAEKRKEAVGARKSSGIEKVWLDCEEAYLGIDDMNRHEFSEARWAKPTSMSGPLTSNKVSDDNVRSTAFVRLTSRYVDFGAAKLSEVVLPIDDKAFSIEPTPVPDLIKKKEDLTPIVDAATGQPTMRPMRPEEAQAQAQQAPTAGQPMPGMAPAAQGAPQMVPMTVADHAKEALDQASQSSDEAEQTIYDWMVESKYPAEARKVFKDGGRIGVGVLKGPVPDFKTSKAMTKVNGAVAMQIKRSVVPVTRWVDPWNFFPADGCGEDIHSGDGLFERDYLSKRKLSKLKEDETYLADQIDQVIEEGPGKIYLDGASPSDRKNKNRFEVWYYYGTLSREDLSLTLTDHDLLQGMPKEQEDFNVIITLVNDTVIRAILNPLDSGAFPYRVFCWSRRPGHWAGVGIAEQMQTAQKMCNAATRAMLNNSGVSSGVQLIINQLGIVPADGKWTLTPNKVWLTTADFSTDDVTKAMAAIQIPNIQQPLMAIVEYAMKIAEESTGIPLITQGQTGATTPDTFGAAELQNTNAHTWIRDIGYTVDDQITEPLINDYYEWLLLDPNVPESAKGDFKINAQGTNAMVERWVQEQIFLGLMNAAANPAFELDPAKVMEEYLKGKRIDPRRVKLSEEQIKQRQQQPPPPPVQVQVEQMRGQSAAQVQNIKNQGELQQIQQEAANEQQMLQTGGASPHQAQAISRIEQEKIKATSSAQIQASRADAELARAEKEREIAQQNGEYRLRELEMQREIALLDYANKRELTLDQVKGQLAKSAMDNQTKHDLSSAEIQLAQNEGDKDRVIDLHKHHNPAPSLVRDEMSTPETP